MLWLMWHVLKRMVDLPTLEFDYDSDDNWELMRLDYTLNSFLIILFSKNTEKKLS